MSSSNNIPQSFFYQCTIEVKGGRTKPPFFQHVNRETEDLYEKATNRNNRKWSS